VWLLALPNTSAFTTQSHPFGLAFNPLGKYSAGSTFGYYLALFAAIALAAAALIDLAKMKGVEPLSLDEMHTDPT